MKEFIRASNGDTWERVAEEGRELYPKMIGMLTTDGIAKLGGVAQAIIKQSHNAEKSGSLVAAPPLEVRLLCYFASSAICEEMARREKEHNDLAARAASQ